MAQIAPGLDHEHSFAPREGLSAFAKRGGKVLLSERVKGEGAGRGKKRK
jgi:hypothetical protein